MWDKISDISSGLKGITIIGSSDIVGSLIGAVFWFYLASLLGAEQYGQISYFLSIASIASTISLLGTENAVSVYVAKSVNYSIEGLTCVDCAVRAHIRCCLR